MELLWTSLAIVHLGLFTLVAVWILGKKNLHILNCHLPEAVVVWIQSRSAEMSADTIEEITIFVVFLWGRDGKEFVILSHPVSTKSVARRGHVTDVN
jgi:hypothetical protein